MVMKKVAFGAVLALAFTSLAHAQGGEWRAGTGLDSNAGNIIPVLNEPNVYGYTKSGGFGMLLPSRAAAIETARVGLQTSNVALTRPMVARAVASIAQGGPYREDALALAMQRLYGRSADSYQTASVGLYGGGYGGYRGGYGGYRGGYGLRTAQVGLYSRPHAAARLHRRAAIRTAPVGLHRGMGAGSVEPMPSAGGY